MRSEFMRKGRFDEVYFVDFPRQHEREQILTKKIERFAGKQKGVPSIYNFSEVMGNIKKIAEMMHGVEISDFSCGFSGAEIESVVNSVIERKFVAYLNNYGGRTGYSISVYTEDFEREIRSIASSIMANQKSSEAHPTSIERIRVIQQIHHFRNASL